MQPPFSPSRRFAVRALICAAAARALEASAQTAHEDRGVAMAYRAAYDDHARFHRLQLARHHTGLRARLKAWPVRRDVDGRPLALRLRSESTDEVLPYDPVGGANLPYLPRMYEEDGLIKLNRPAGSYTLSTQYSIAPRPDGRYTLQWLRAAGEDLHRLVKEFSLLHRLSHFRKSCAGIMFVFHPVPADAPLVLRTPDGVDRAIPSPVLRVHGSQSPLRAAIMRQRFDDWPGDAELVTTVPPALIDIFLD